MILLIGPSASGKTETSKALSKYGIKKVVTYTTRPIRINEVDKVDYNFLTKEEFEKKIKENFFLEHTLYNGNYYGTSKDSIKEGYCLIVEPKGLNNIRKFTNDFKVFFFKSSKEVLKQRMIFRGDKKEDIEKRLANDEKEFDLKLIKPDFILDSDNKTIEEMAEQIYNTLND